VGPPWLLCGLLCGVLCGVLGGRLVPLLFPCGVVAWASRSSCARCSRSLVVLLWGVLCLFLFLLFPFVRLFRLFVGRRTLVRLFVPLGLFVCLVVVGRRGLARFLWVLGVASLRLRPSGLRLSRRWSPFGGLRLVGCFGLPSAFRLWRVWFAFFLRCVLCSFGFLAFLVGFRLVLPGLFWGCSWLLLFLGLCPCLFRSFLRAVLFLLAVLVLLPLLFLFRLRLARLVVLWLVWLGVLALLALGPLFLVVRLRSFLLVLVPWWFGSRVVFRLRVWLSLFLRLLTCSRWPFPLVLPLRLVRLCSRLLPWPLGRLAFRLATFVVWLLLRLRLLLLWVRSPSLWLGSSSLAFGLAWGSLGFGLLARVVP